MIEPEPPEPREGINWVKWAAVFAALLTIVGIVGDVRQHSGVEAGSPFPIHNLPYGVFSVGGDRPRVGVRLLHGCGCFESRHRCASAAGRRSTRCAK